MCQKKKKFTLDDFYNFIALLCVRSILIWNFRLLCVKKLEEMLLTNFQII